MTSSLVYSAEPQNANFGRRAVQIPRMNSLSADPQEARDSAQKKKARLPVRLASGPWESPKGTKQFQLCAHTRVPPRQHFSLAATTGRNDEIKIHKKNNTDADSHRQAEYDAA
jgi:hypothetical protein